MNTKQIIERAALLACLGLCVAVLASSPAFAGTANDIFGAKSPIKKITDFMTGPLAYTIVVIGIVVIGSLLMFGNDLSGFGRRVMLLVLGGGLVLGSVTVVGNLFSEATTGAIYVPVEENGGSLAAGPKTRSHITDTSVQANK